MFLFTFCVLLSQTTREEYRSEHLAMLARFLDAFKKKSFKLSKYISNLQYMIVWIKMINE